MSDSSSSLHNRVLYLNKYYITENWNFCIPPATPYQYKTGLHFLYDDISAQCTDTLKLEYGVGNSKKIKSYLS